MPSNSTLTPAQQAIVDAAVNGAPFRVESNGEDNYADLQFGVFADSVAYEPGHGESWHDAEYGADERAAALNTIAALAAELAAERERRERAEAHNLQLRKVIGEHSHDVLARIEWCVDHDLTLDASNSGDGDLCFATAFGEDADGYALVEFSWWVGSNTVQVNDDRETGNIRVTHAKATDAQLEAAWSAFTAARDAGRVGG